MIALKGTNAIRSLFRESVFLKCHRHRVRKRSMMNTTSNISSFAKDARLQSGRIKFPQSNVMTPSHETQQSMSMSMSTLTSTTVSPKTLESIKSLPEISSALHGHPEALKPSRQTIEGLERASQIFKQFNPGGEEYKAVLVIKAQSLMKMKQYEEAMGVLDSLLRSCEQVQDASANETENNDNLKFQLTLAKIQMMYYTGKWDEAIGLAQEMVDQVPQNGHGDRVSLNQSVALNMFGLCRSARIGIRDVDMDVLRRGPGPGANAGTNAGEEEEEKVIDTNFTSKHLQDANEVQEILRMASKILQQRHISAQSQRHAVQSGDHLSLPPSPTQMGLACAASYSNLGIVELLSSIIQAQLLKRDANVSIDRAMMSWREALNVLDGMEDNRNAFEFSDEQTKFQKSVRARVYGNMTWAILFSSNYSGNSKVKEEDLKLASEYSGKALKINDEISNADQSLSRILCLVASCYARAGSAVTAEGLFQSAIDSCNTDSPVSNIDARSVMVNYSKLCDDWDKREADAEKYRLRAIESDDQLVDGWRGLASIYSGGHSFLVGDL